MARRGSQIKPTFVWQPILIVLPVLILAGIGAFSVRQDKALARQEATDRAQMLADELLEQVRVELTPTNTGGWDESRGFQLNRSGELLFPPPLAPVPIPKPFDLSVLSSEESRLWRDARATEELPQSGEAALASYRQFLASGPPEDFAAAAHYSSALLLLSKGDLPSATEMFDALLEKYPEARGESGLPLAPLAQLKLIEKFLEANRLLSRTIDGSQSLNPTNLIPSKHLLPVDAFCSNLVNYSTTLTPYILNRPWESRR